MPPESRKRFKAALALLEAGESEATERWIPEHLPLCPQLSRAPPNTMLVWIGRRWDLANPVWLGTAELFDFHLMPVIIAFPQFPLPPGIERYRREGHPSTERSSRSGRFFALALQHDWPELQARPKPESEADGAFLQIWPTGPAVRWPPRRHNDDLADTHRITRFFQIAPPLVPVYQPWAGSISASGELP